MHPRIAFDRGFIPLTQRFTSVTRSPMQNRKTRTATYGPWLVGLGAALWGTESAWRIPLNELFDAKVIVFWEHVFILIMFLPILISRLHEIPRVRARTWGFLIFSGFAGSAVGTVFFTLALKYGNPTVVNVVLNVQPVISTLGAFFLFGDRLARQFFLYAGIAIVAGVFVSVAYPTQIGVSFERAGLNVGTGYALICALFWGLSTVAGRGVMVGMSLRLASSLRIVIGLACMTLILLAYGKLNGAALWPEAAQAHPIEGHRVVAFPRVDLRRGSAPDLFSRTASHPRIHSRLLRNDANARRSLHHLGFLPCQSSPASGNRGHRSDCCGSDGAPYPTTGRTS